MTVTIKCNIKDMPHLKPAPMDWPTIFGNNHPVDLEIGCGRPHFLLGRARNLPERNIVGVEWKREFVRKAHKSIARENLNNAFCLHGNAWALIPFLFTSTSISQVILNFPDPWWKDRHKKRLVLNRVFLSILHKRLQPNAALVLQTDVKDLFDFYTELLQADGLFTFDAQLSPDDIANAMHARTHRETKCLEQGLAIFRGSFKAAVTLPSRP